MCDWDFFDKEDIGQNAWNLDDENENKPDQEDGFYDHSGELEGGDVG